MIFSRKSTALPLLAIIVLLGLGCTTADTHRDITGTYRAYLESPGGELAFPLHVESVDGDSLTAYAVNGADTSRFTTVRLSANADSVTFSFDYYDSHINAAIAPDGKLSGEWNRRSTGGNRIRMPFHAEKGVRYRYPETDPQHPGRFEGNWQVTYQEDDGSTSPGYGMFVTEPGGRIHGTVRTETGDARFLEGVYTDSTMILSTFDGSHAWMTRATWKQDSTLDGTFYYYNTSRKDWTARRGDDNLRDPLQISAEQAVGKKISFAFPDLQGDTVRAASPRFSGKPMLVYLFGSWCPNCSDEARMLRTLYGERYSDTDLEVVGLAYEYTGNFSDDAEMVRRYRERFNIPWTLLVAGVSSKSEAAKTLPFLNDVISFPTSIFVNRNHIIEAIHVGFNGPATGSAYFKEKQSFTTYLDEITQR